MSVYAPATMKDKVFQSFSAFIYDKVGIQMPPAKKTMLEARLQKRLKELGLGSFEEYGEFVFSREGQSSELVHMIDVVTTNKTDFFREPGHFSFLTDTALPAVARMREISRFHPLRIWSAGCSSGEEPYTLSMVLSEYMADHRDFRLFPARLGHLHPHSRNRPQRRLPGRSHRGHRPQSEKKIPAAQQGPLAGPGTHLPGTAGQDRLPPHQFHGRRFRHQ
jgi:hypothetical protein